MTFDDVVMITNQINSTFASILNAVNGNYIKIINQINTTTMISTAVLAVIGIAILWNQRKIKKQLKQLLEEKGDKHDA